MSVKLFTGASLPDKYRSQILDSDFCRRGASFISPEWITYQLGRASYVVVALESWNVCGFLIGFNFDKANPLNSELEDHEKAHDVWWLDTICRNADRKYGIITGWLIDRFVAEALKHGVLSIGLYATTPESTKAYTKYCFKQVGAVQEDGGAQMKLDLF